MEKKLLDYVQCPLYFMVFLGKAKREFFKRLGNVAVNEDLRPMKLLCPMFLVALSVLD